MYIIKKNVYRKFSQSDDLTVNLLQFTFFFCFFGAAFWENDSSITMSSNSQPVFTLDSSAERELEQTEADALGADLPLVWRLSPDCTLSLNEAFSEVLENSSDKLSFRMSSDLSSKFSSKFSFGFSPESSSSFSCDLDVDWKKNRLHFESGSWLFPIRITWRS